MKLIVGLGNPGAQYARTRHNVGFMTVDRLQGRHAPGAVPRSRFHAWTVEARLPGLDGVEEPCLLMKPTTYMNRSGQSVAEAVRFYKVDSQADLLVIVDDVHLPCGTIRLRAEGGAGGHNGLANIEQLLATSGYARLRIGVDAPGIVPQADYVLSAFTEDERTEIDQALDRSVEAAEHWAREGIESVMNKYNARTRPPKPTRTQTDETEPKQGEALSNDKSASSSKGE